jgi:membrane-associated two-gene conflict system component 1 (EACC1)
MDAHLSLQVTAPDATDEEIADVTRELTSLIGDAVEGCEVSQQTAAGSPGGKGLLEVLGRLGVNLLAPGALKALIDCLAVYIKEQRRDVTVILETPSGARLTLNAGGIGRSELDQLLHQLQDMMGGPITGHT